VNRIRTTPTNLIAAIMAAMSFFSLAFASVDCHGTTEISSPWLDSARQSLMLAVTNYSELMGWQ